MNDKLIVEILENFKKYHRLGFPKEQIYKMMDKVEFALLTFYFFEKEEQEQKNRINNQIEKAEIIIKI